MTDIFFHFRFSCRRLTCVALTAVEKEQLSITAQQHGGEISVGQRHHAACAENKSFP
jgi:hypothetical protein